MPPHVRRGGARGRSNTPPHAAQARAGLSAARPAPRTQAKFAAFDEFCKRLFYFLLFPFISRNRDLSRGYAGLSQKKNYDRYLPARAVPLRAMAAGLRRVPKDRTRSVL